MTALSTRESMDTIDKFIREVGAAEKTAAEANSEPGSVGGATEHPVKDVDDSTESADEGFRSEENNADVKADEGSPSVDSQPVAKAPSLAGSSKAAAEGKSEGGAAGDPVQSPGSASDDQIQIGTVKEPTGDDPSVETASVKEEKEDSSTGHPARADNSSLDGLKYAEADLESMPMEELAKIASSLNNAILAELAVHDFHKAADEDEDEDDADSSDCGVMDISVYADDKEAVDLASQAGAELAGLLTGDLDKRAVDGIVQSTLEDVIKTASADADRVTVFLANYADESQKQANATTQAQSLLRRVMLKKAEGEMLPPMAAGGPAGEAALGGMDEEALVQQLLGEGGAPAEEDAMAGLGGGEEEALALQSILEEFGISPEELEAALAAEGGGGGLEAPMPGIEGVAEEVAPELGGDEAALGLEVEASYKLAAAKKGNAMAGVRDYIQELITRSRSR